MRLSLRQTQRVVMTPLLQQAIQLLQLSTLELEQVVRKELEENPLLEEVPAENAGRTPERPEAADRAAERAGPSRPARRAGVQGDEPRSTASRPTTCPST